MFGLRRTHEARPQVRNQALVVGSKAAFDSKRMVPWADYFD
jgi:hypothetical protein